MFLSSGVTLQVVVGFKLSGLLVNHRLRCSYELAWLLIDGMLLGAASIGVALLWFEVVAVLGGAAVMR